MQERLQTTIPSSNKWHSEDVELRAKALGMEKSELVFNAVDMMMNFDEIFLKRIQSYAEGLHIPEWMVMQNMLLDRMANESAEYKVYGKRPKLLVEFMLIGEGTERRSVTGKELTDSLEEMYVRKFEKELLKQTLQEERYGIPLQKRERDLLIKYRCGNAWLESDEYKSEIEEEKQFNEKYPDAVRKQKEHIEKMKADLKAARQSELYPDETVTPEELAEWQKD